MKRTYHVVGAGLAGLAACLRLLDGGGDVVLHEATDHAGGRCRSYYEPALDSEIERPAVACGYCGSIVKARRK